MVVQISLAFQNWNVTFRLHNEKELNPGTTDIGTVTLRASRNLYQGQPDEPLSYHYSTLNNL